MQVLRSGQPATGVEAQPSTRATRAVHVLERGLGPALQPVQRYGEYALGALTFIGMMVTIWAALIYAPPDAVEGNTQRIFYFHVPVSLVAYLAFFVVFAASILYLWLKDERWDWLARASAEIGTVFTTLTLITGSLWGRPIWGAWWVWDARLTTSLILWFIYVGYLLLRFYTGRAPGGARAAAVLGILGFIDVPINYLSVTWWRTLHPLQVVPLGGTPQLPPQMLIALLIALGTFLALYGFLLVQVYRLERSQTTVLRLRALVEYADGDEE